jgi:hypothetical protein
MKAVKLYKITWDLGDLSNDEKEKVIKNLPTVKGFTTQDDFDVVNKVPGLLKKKFGYDVASYSYVELRIVDNINDFLKLFMGKGVKPKKLYKKFHKGKIEGKELSAFGEELWDAFQFNVKYRLDLESKGEAEENFPILLDEMMLGFEKITGLNWETLTFEEIVKGVKDILRGKGVSINNIEDLTGAEEMDEDEVEDDDKEEE